MKKFSFRLLACAAAFGFAPNAFATVSSYTHRDVNSSEYVYSLDYQATHGWVTDYSGGAVSISYSGSRDWAFGNGAGGYMYRTEASLVSAAADLSTGTLKAHSSVYIGSNNIGSEPVAAPGIRYTGARAESAFADSLRFFNANGTSYKWADGQTVSIDLSLDGKTKLPEGQGIAADYTGGSWASLVLNIYRTGGLEAMAQLNNFRFMEYTAAHGSDAAWAEWTRLDSALAALEVSSAGWCLGASSMPSGFCSGANFYQPVGLDDRGAAAINYSFAPGGDFEFSLALSTKVAVDLYYGEAQSEMDFSHTVAFGFSAPADAVTYSASGMLPQTQPMPVPEPSQWALLAGGLLAVGWRARRNLPARG